MSHRSVTIVLAMCVKATSDWEPAEPFQCCIQSQHSSWIPAGGLQEQDLAQLMPPGGPKFSRWSNLSSCFGSCVRNPRGFPSLGHPHLPPLLCFSTGSSGLCFTDFPCLQLLRFPCCGFSGAFLNCELVNSCRPFQQWKQSKSLVFPPGWDRQNSAALHVEPELPAAAPIPAGSNCTFSAETSALQSSPKHSQQLLSWLCWCRYHWVRYMGACALFLPPDSF